VETHGKLLDRLASYTGGSRKLQTQRVADLPSPRSTKGATRVFAEGDAVVYLEPCPPSATSYTERDARIVAAHFDDGEPYYTVAIEGVGERETEASRLRPVGSEAIDMREREDSVPAQPVDDAASARLPYQQAVMDAMILPTSEKVRPRVKSRAPAVLYESTAKLRSNRL
jgi:hypothetical protein